MQGSGQGPRHAKGTTEEAAGWTQIDPAFRISTA